MALKVMNLSKMVTESDLVEVFSQHGTVLSAVMTTDRETGRFTGWAIVKLETPEQENSAISAMNGVEWMGRQLRVIQATAKR